MKKKSKKNNSGKDLKERKNLVSITDLKTEKENNYEIYDLDEAEAPQAEKQVGFLMKIFLYFQTIKNKIIEYIRKKKKERLTLMFIPHNEKSIRHYHISNLNLSIILISISILIIISAVLVVNHNSTVQEVDKLKVSHKDAKKQFKKIRSEISLIHQSFDGVRENLVNLYALIKGEKAKALFAKGGKENISFENIENKSIKDVGDEKIPVEIYMLNRILEDIKIADKPLSEIKDYIQKRKKIFKNTPTLWPVKGYILNPYGYVRNAQTLKIERSNGIDIASFPGNPVVATAPGKVISIKKDLQWNWTVKIKHKYRYYTVYKGLERVTVPIGEELAKGENLGYIGYSKDSIENILHYEIHVGVEAIDPMPYVNYIRE